MLWTDHTFALGVLSISMRSSAVLWTSTCEVFFHRRLFLGTGSMEWLDWNRWALKTALPGKKTARSSYKCYGLTLQSERRGASRILPIFPLVNRKKWLEDIPPTFLSWTIFQTSTVDHLKRYFFLMRQFRVMVPSRPTAFAITSTPASSGSCSHCKVIVFRFMPLAISPSTHRTEFWSRLYTDCAMNGEFIVCYLYAPSDKCNLQIDDDIWKEFIGNGALPFASKHIQ